MWLDKRQTHWQQKKKKQWHNQIVHVNKNPSEINIFLHVNHSLLGKTNRNWIYTRRPLCKWSTQPLMITTTTLKPSLTCLEAGWLRAPRCRWSHEAGSQSVCSHLQQVTRGGCENWFSLLTATISTLFIFLAKAAKQLLVSKGRDWMILKHSDIYL